MVDMVEVFEAICEEWLRLIFRTVMDQQGLTKTLDMFSCELINQLP